MRPKFGKMDLQVSSASDGGSILRLVLREKLDREMDSSHVFVVSAMDGGHPSLTGSMTIQVDVADANDNTPVFEQTTYEVTIAEDTAPLKVILKVKATDLDLGVNAEVVYALSERTSEESGNVFGIDHVTGEIFLKDVLDYEGQTAYHLTILAYDSGPESLPGQATVVVHVGDVNDNRPEVEISFLTPTGRPEVTENAPAGEFVAFVSAMDADSGKDGDVDCHVTSGTKEFAIERVYRSQYKVVTAVSFDRESQTSADFVLECRDSGLEPRTSDSTVRIAILDENDNAPSFPVELYSASVLDNNEPEVVVLTVTARDLDAAGNNSVVTYRLLDDDVIGDVFSVEPETGIVRANVVLDRRASSRFEFVVYAEDRGLPVQTGSALVIVDVIGVDDELSVFGRGGSYVFYVPENSPVGTEVGSVTALNGDSSLYNYFWYFIDEELENQSVFRIDLWTGSIETREELDREVLASIN